MSEIQEVDLFIQPDGNVRVEVRGVQGQQCLVVTREIEQSLGGRVLGRTYTDEYYQPEQDQSQGARIEQKQGQ